jgi:hypothetical protein
MNRYTGLPGDILRKGASTRRALDGIQADIVATCDAIQALKGSLLPLEETRDLVLDSINRAIYANPPENVFQAFQNRVGDRGFPSVYVHTINKEDVSIPVFGIGTLAWLEGPEVLADKIVARLKKNGRAVGLPEEKYTVELEKSQTKLDQLERDEEIETLRLEAAGHVILRRESARPEIVFQVWSEQDGGATA